MDGFMTAVSTTYREKDKLPVVEERSPTHQVKVTINSPEDALQVLREEPDYTSLTAALRFLARGISQKSNTFNVAVPSPIGAQIVQALATDIASNYWTLLKEDGSHGSRQESRGKGASGLQAFIQCLRSITGVNAVLLRLRALSSEAKSEKEVKRPDIAANLKITLELLCALLDDHDSPRQIWTSTAAGADSSARRGPMTLEFLTLLGCGRVISWAAEAEEMLKAADKETEGGSFWVTNGAEYSPWLARSICQWISCEIPTEDSKICSHLLGEALRLGHPDTVVKLLVESLLLSKGSNPDRFQLLYDGLPKHDQRKVLLTVLTFLAEAHLNRLGGCDSSESAAVISAAAGIISAIVGQDQDKTSHLITWLTSTSGAGLGEGVGIRRAVLAVVSQNKESVANVLERTVAQFGDQLYVKHSPILQQEAHAQVLLLSAGYVHRLAPLKLSMITRSSPWLNAISNRLGTSQQRARFLGMVVGEAISGLVDKAEKKLDFHTEETNLDEGKWYKGLVGTSDKIGQIDRLRLEDHTPKAKVVRPVKIPAMPERRPVGRQPTQGFIIEEIEDESEDDDLVPYAKPDSDAEDSDEDPTLVRRDKPKAPVYIRDLIRYLRDTESYDHQKLALTTTPALVRRKANYGTEVKEHTEELATLLVGLQDKFEIDNFHDLRVQGMIALIIAQPQVMGRWMARTFFDGDYSVSQRASVLIVLGISARELAGFETSEYKEAASFPSMSLPEPVERLYLGSTSSRDQLPSSSSLKALPPNALETFAKSLTTGFLAPIAANAADAATGPDALKLSTFTSRLQQQQGAGTKGNVKVKSTPRARVRAIPNTTAQLLYTSFFSPLTARFQAALHSPASRLRGIIFQPYLLSLYLKTLAIILHAAGPSTLALPQMTSELWGLLLNTSVRAHCVGELTVTHAVLFALLAMLDVNEDRMRDVCRDMSREVVETQEWVAAVFEGIRGGDAGEENDAKMLAAAVLIRLREGMEKYRLLLVGDLIGF